MSALIYQPTKKWRFCVALAAAAAIHLAALSFANVQRPEPPIASGIDLQPPAIDVDPTQPDVDPQPDVSDPLPSPPTIAPEFPEVESTPIRRQTNSRPIVRPRENNVARPSMLSSAKVFAVSAPRPPYPFEARRQKITGDGIALLTVDPASGNVIHVTMSRSTGNQFLDQAAVTGFGRWRFRPGTVSSVVCPVTFSLIGASY